MKTDMVLLEYLPVIVNSTFFRSDTHHDIDTRRILRVYVNDLPLEMNSAEVIITNKPQRKIQVSIGNDYALDKIATTLLGKTFPLEDVDEFQLIFKQAQGYTKKVDTETYFKLIAGMPCVGMLSLGIPPSYVESEKIITNNEQLVFVKQLRIFSDAETNIQMLLDGCCPILPNLRSMDLENFSGIWAENLGEFQLVLPRKTLETLTIDTSAIETKTLQHLKKENIEEGDFAVLLVELLDGGERPLYKISLHDFSITRIHGKDLKGFVRGDDYLRIHITIRTLQKLEIFHLNKNTKVWYSKAISIIDA